MTVGNQELADVFRECAQILQYQGKGWFTVRAYLTAADVLVTHPDPVVALSDDQLRALPGVGKAIFTKIRAYQASGTFNLLDRVRQVPEGIRALLMQGLSPAAMRALEAQGITTAASLRAAHAQPGGLSALSSQHRRAVHAFVSSQQA
jgi:DNA polymerase/3'-5' exonuclease PolX